MLKYDQKLDINYVESDDIVLCWYIEPEDDYENAAILMESNYRKHFNKIIECIHTYLEINYAEKIDMCDLKDRLGKAYIYVDIKEIAFYNHSLKYIIYLSCEFDNGFDNLKCYTLDELLPNSFKLEE